MTQASGVRVVVIDDDDSMRESIEGALSTHGYSVASYSGPLEYLERAPQRGADCLVLDLRLPDMSGIELQRTLNETGADVPIVFISGHADVPAAVQAMKAGAIDFLAKPFRRGDLLEAVARAIERGRRERAENGERAAARQLFQTLSPQEERVCRLVAAGLLNKQVAAELGIAEHTVRVHRSRVMHKMKVDSVAALVRILARVDAGP